MSQGFKGLYKKAATAGHAAAKAATPAPMVVGTAVGLTDEIDSTKPRYFVPEGVCGFAWIIVRPGNCRFANWLKRQNLAKHDSYYGGVTIWVGEYGQSMTRKEAYAHAFATVLRDAGITAYPYSRMD
jgi:hypothetical protein